MHVIRIIFHKSVNPHKLAVSYVVDDILDRSVSIEWSDPIPQSLFRECVWYMEEFLDEADSAALFRANTFRQQLPQMGVDLFSAIFHSSTEASELWNTIKPNLSNLHIELHIDSPADHPLWELLRESASSEPLCVLARSFVRKPLAAHASAEVPRLSSTPRLLLVISRPSGNEDVEYRSIATEIFETLFKGCFFEVVILRPATFTECAKTLRDAHSDNRPFDIVHFDGHGVSTETNQNETQAGAFIVFESDTPERSGHLVSAQQFAGLAAECRVKLVVLNACRSAYNVPLDSRQVPLTFQGRPPNL